VTQGGGVRARVNFPRAVDANGFLEDTPESGQGHLVTMTEILFSPAEAEDTFPQGVSLYHQEEDLSLQDCVALPRPDILPDPGRLDLMVVICPLWPQQGRLITGRSAILRLRYYTDRRLEMVIMTSTTSANQLLMWLCYPHFMLALWV
jgi:hypothetical protein